MNAPTTRGLPADHVVVADDVPHLCAALAGWMCDRLATVRGRDFALAISGGRTPLALYRLLGSPAWRNSVAWDRLHVFWCDERCVPRADAASNFGVAHAAWLARVPVSQERLHPVPVGEAPAAAAAYDAQLRAFYGASRLDPARPLFDITLLGVGADGHTASLFPGSPALAEQQAWAVPVSRPEPPSRVSLTLPVLGSTHAVAFLVTGADKASIVGRLAAGDDSLPAAQVRTRGERIWFLDRAAAAELA